MQVLEKILQEIDKKADYYESNEQGRERIRMVDMVEVEDIIRFHMEDDGWIPVEERLPTREEYLKDDGRFMLDDGNRRYQGIFDIYDGKFKLSGQISGINYTLLDDECVIAWQPLPAPYQPKEGGGMLKPAQLYKDRLLEEYVKTWYKPENIYYTGWTGDRIPEIPDNNYDSHHFVSVDKNDNLIGYISYSVDWISMSADRFGIISFDKGNIEFAKDVHKAICNLFEVFHMNRISWFAYVENPAIKGYRNFIKKHGGKECGYHRQIARLQDGKLHDSVEFEILAEEFRR